MKVSLVTSPHLDHSYRAASPVAGGGPRRPAQCFVPMGLLSLAAAADPADVTILDINKAINSGVLPMSGSFYDAAAEWLVSGSPDMVGFMTESDSYHHLLKILRQVKARRPEVITLLGGVHATAVHRETVEAFDSVDLIVRGEGEIPFAQLVHALERSTPLSDVCNLTFRDNGTVLSTPEAPLIEELDRLPFPRFDRVQIAAEDVIYVEIGRGCPFKCNFCFTAPYWKRRHRIKTPARIIEELSYLGREHGRYDFNFTHDLFTTDRKWVIAFCQELVAQGISVTWTCSSRTDTLDEEQLYWMQRAGCRDIYFGVETGTAEMQARINKDLDLGQAREIIRKTVDAGVGATVGFIAGLPGETPQTLQGTLTEAFHYLGLSKSVVHLFGFCPYKGSPHFPSIADSLELDESFLDFPLSDEVHTDNCALMKRHFELFSRYGRLTALEGFDEGVLQAASEYFPIVNALKGLMLYLQQDGAINNLDLLQSWAAWIGSANDQRGRVRTGKYQGTIADFLSFLEEYLLEHDRNGDVINDLLSWERQKNALRSITPVDWGAEGSRRDGEIVLNPSVRTGRFRFAPGLLADQRPGVFAFYLRRTGSPSIVRLGEIGAAVLQLAQDGADVDGIATSFRAVTAAPEQPFQQVASVLAELKEADLVLSY